MIIADDSRRYMLFSIFLLLQAVSSSFLVSTSIVTAYHVESTLYPAVTQY